MPLQNFLCTSIQHRRKSTANVYYLSKLHCVQFMSNSVINHSVPTKNNIKDGCATNYVLKD